jgi:hypothetical protein
MEEFDPSREAASWPPTDGFTRIAPGVKQYGVPDGSHTGGVYLSPDGKEVWKPLVGLWPRVTAQGHVYLAAPTEEVECLEAAAGLRSFPRIWRVEEAAGKRWIVRPRAIPIKTPQEAREHLSLDHIYQVEADIYALNKRGWAIYDGITVAVWRGQRFVLDLSNAHTCKMGWSDDKDHVMRWLVRCVGIPWLTYLRQEGRQLLNPFSGRFDACRDYAIEQFESEFNHVYASRYRPMSGMWAPREWWYVQGTDHDMQMARVHTWVITKERLQEDHISRYELTPAYLPWK